MKMPMVRILDFFMIVFYTYTYIVLDMRKACSRDVKQKSVIPLTHPVRPEDVD